MAIRVPYTTTIDRMLILPRFIIKAILLISILGGLSVLLEHFDIFKILNLNTTISIILFILLLIGGIALSNYIFTKTAGELFYTLSFYLYVKYKLKTKLSWKDANFVAFLFTPNDSGKWYTMTEVLKMAEEKRAAYIKNFAEKILIEYTLLQRK